MRQIPPLPDHLIVVPEDAKARGEEFPRVTIEILPGSQNGVSLQGDGGPCGRSWAVNCRDGNLRGIFKLSDHRGQLCLRRP